MSGPTPKQRVARERNWQIRRLRGLWASCGSILSPGRADHARSIIDTELRLMGAEGERDRRERLRAELEGAA